MKRKQIIGKVLDILVGVLVGTFIIGGFVFTGIQGAARSDPRIALVLGQPISGTVQTKDRTYGFAVTVATGAYGNIQVPCTSEQYDTFSIGDTVTISCDLTIKG